ncbi:MAG TPA: GNAT family N-acetyltransferase [Streptosporangiaceae bacterium]|nr:GNAT family N-acetyltransferase [Streptosporangiaceae bacterium]
MKIRAGAYEVDDDPGRVDLDAAVAFLTTQAYWARWRTGAVIKEQVSQAARLVGAYDEDGAMVGLARAFGDGVTLYLADVYVEPGHRGAGLGKAIVRLMIDDGPYAASRWMLHTSDAHGLYRQFGFGVPGSRSMERPRGAEPLPPDPLDTGVLTGVKVALEPLGYRHLDGLVAASADGGDLYRLSAVPRGAEQMRQYIETAIAGRDRGTSVPYAVRRLLDGVLIGSTRFWDIGYWSWERPVRLPDTCEIGYTWLSPRAIRTGANSEMKLLMLTHAFEIWGVQLVCLHTDARNERSRAAMERFGARFEGVLRSHRLASDGGPRDSARYTVTATEWPAVRDRFAEMSLRYQAG